MSFGDSFHRAQRTCQLLYRYPCRHTALMSACMYMCVKVGSLKHFFVAFRRTLREVRGYGLRSVTKLFGGRDYYRSLTSSRFNGHLCTTIESDVSSRDVRQRAALRYEIPRAGEYRKSRSQRNSSGRATRLIHRIISKTALFTRNLPLSECRINVDSLSEVARVMKVTVEKSRARFVGSGNCHESARPFQSAAGYRSRRIGH